MRKRGDTAAATRLAPPATSTAAETSSAPRSASTSSGPPSAALAARLGPSPQPPFNEVTVTGRHRRSGDNAFIQGSVACMARNLRSIFAKEEATAVVGSAALLVELPEERPLSVDGAWRLMRDDSWEAWRRSEIIMGLMTSLRVAHGHCASQVLYGTAHQDNCDQEHRALAVSWDRNG